MILSLRWETPTEKRSIGETFVTELLKPGFLPEVVRPNAVQPPTVIRLAVGGAAEKKNVIASSAWERYRLRKLLIVPSSATKKAEHGRHYLW